jgi:hypothetical protein
MERRVLSWEEKQECEVSLAESEEYTRKGVETAFSRSASVRHTCSFGVPNAELGV